ncbi:MAG TPA: LPS export ABC transporter permease LptF [Acidiferrobacterales bacterium]|nr:LPS export ABC transporter permease LptF [Acidiferrobacterales bacterium]
MFAYLLSKKPANMRSAIIDRAFYREVSQTSLIVTVVFVVLYVVISLVNLLAKAATGQLPVHIIFVLLGLQTVKNLSLILPLVIFIAILMTLGRWYRDSEMTVLAACGISLLHFLRPTWVVALWAAGMVALVSFYFAPLASSLTDKVKSENTGPYEFGVAAGEFNRSRRGGSVFYVERVNKDATLENIFVSNEQLGKRGVLVAKSGYEFTNQKTGDRFLVLRDGTRYEGTPGHADYKILHYETYAVRIEPQIPVNPVAGLSELPTRQLFASDDRLLRAEWQWRLAKPISLFILATLALVFAYTDVHRGRFANLFTAILIYFIYANLLGVAQALIMQERIPVGLGLWWVHAGFALLTAYLIFRRAYNKPLLPAITRFHKNT